MSAANMPNGKVSIDELVIKALYYRFKDFIVPVSTIGICILLWMFLIIPQIQSWLTMRDQVAGDSDKLTVLKQNLQTITSLDDKTLDANLDLASRALPTDKDFVGVLRAISSAAAAAGSILGDYSFQIGDLTGSSQAKQAQQPLQLTISLKGDLSTAKRFVEEIKSQLPLSDVTEVSVNTNGTLAVTLVFYYAPLPKITFDDTVPLVTLSKKDQEVLKLLDLGSNTNPSLTPALPEQASSSAAIAQ